MKDTNKILKILKLCETDADAPVYCLDNISS